MTKAELHKELNYVNHSREKRLHYANLVSDNPELTPTLLATIFDVNTEISCRAAWVFEFMCSQHINTIIPYLDTFTKNIHTVHLDSAVRPVAKVCELIAKTYNHKSDSELKTQLTQLHKKRIVEACFDWMITDQKVAVKAYSMQTLFLLGKEFDWIYPELKTLLERDFSSQSAAYKARARHILRKISHFKP